MIDLITHIVRISSFRDRTEINGAMLDALVDLFIPQALTIYRCYPNKRKMLLFPCASHQPQGRFVRNAYLPDPTACRPIECDALLQRCRRERSAVFERINERTHRIIFPIMRLDEPLYMIDLCMSEAFSADQRIALMGLIEYFDNHIALLDYGESDALTNLSSRKTFDKHLFELLGQPSIDAAGTLGETRPKRRRGAQETAEISHWLAVCDVDHFKRINDNFGHLIGDEVLIMLAQLMRQSFRFDDQLFRFGGEEFVALLQPTDLDAARTTLERFRKAVAKQVFSRVGHISISIGFCRLQPHDTPTDAIDRADEALYFAKRAGRNQVCNYETLVSKQQLPPRENGRGNVEFF